MTCEILKGTCLTEWSTWTSSLVPHGGTLTLSFKQLSGRNAYLKLDGSTLGEKAHAPFSSNEGLA